MKIRLSNFTFTGGVLSADVEFDGVIPSVPPVTDPLPGPPLALPTGYDYNATIAREMLLAAVRENGLNAVDVQRRGDQIVAALKRTYPSLDVYLNPKTDAIVWPGFGSVDVTIDSGRGGWYFRPDGHTPWKPVGQR